MSRRAAAVAGWAMFALTVGLSVPILIIAAGSGPPRIEVRSALEAQASLELTLIAVVVFITFASVGALILTERPWNGIGWVFAIDGPIGTVVILAYAYGYRALASEPGSLPAGSAAAWVSDIVAPLLFCSITVALFLLFPQGRLDTTSEKVTGLIAICGIGLAMAGAVVEPSLLDYEAIPTPLGTNTSSGISMTLIVLGYLVITLAVVASVVLLIARMRRSVGREREQLRLLVSASLIAAILFAPTFFLPSLIEGLASTWLFLVSAIAVLLIPVSVGVAILRHQLLDIQLVIRRTVVIALMGGFITLIYIGIVVGVGASVGSTGSATLSAVAAAIVAIAFQPARGWAQRIANRLVFGVRATPYEVVHEFSERVAGAYGTEDVLPRMAQVLGQGTGAQRAQVWLRSGAELRPAASWPNAAARPGAEQVHGEELPDIAGVSLAVPVLDEGHLLGALSITKDPSEPVSETDERLVADLALQAGLVLRNVRLVEDLRESRGRLVAAQDSERRKLERDIHDGAQQQLVALAIKAKLADTMVDRDTDRAHQILAELQAEAQAALDSLRDLARGIYPPLLADRGLVEALTAQARKAPIPVTMNADGLGRYPQAIEATVYFCCLEALQNVGKYAEAKHVEVTLGAPDGLLTFTVADDGRGFEPTSTPRGMGLQNMADRLDAVGGSLEIDSAPGKGTTIRGAVPKGANDREAGSSPSNRVVTGPR